MKSFFLRIGQVWSRLRMLRGFLILVNDPTQTERVFHLSNYRTQKANPIFQATMKRLFALPSFRDMFETGYDPQLPTVEELAKYPDGTLGREFARHLQSNNLILKFYPLEKDSEFAHFAINRMRKMHDLWHVILGFDTTVCGELGVQGFSLAQFRASLAGSLIAAGFLHCIAKKPELFDECVESIVHGYQLGKVCRPLAAERLEERLLEPVEDIRRDLGITSLTQKRVA